MQVPLTCDILQIIVYDCIECHLSQSNRPTKKSRLKDYYTQLAQNVGRLHSQGRLKGFKAGNMRPRQDGERVARAAKETVKEEGSGPDLKNYMDDVGLVAHLFFTH